MESISRWPSAADRIGGCLGWATGTSRVGWGWLPWPQVFAVRGCLDYNVVAGTDKTPAHIVQISAAVLAGPMVGPVANPGAGEYPQAWTWAAILFAVGMLAASPIVFVRSIVHPAIALICWMVFLASTILWFFGAMISLGVFLS